MINLLIVDKSASKSRSILNYISEYNEKIRVCSIVSSLEDGIKILKKENADIAIINTNEDLQKIIFKLNEICKQYYKKYVNSVLLISKEFNQNITSKYVYEIISNKTSIHNIIQKINKMVENKTQSVNNFILVNKINKELEYIGYNMSYNGTKYLRDCIYLIYKNYDDINNLKQNVYPVISNKYKKSINSIKSNITTATFSMFYDCDENKLKKYFSFSEISKPKPKLVIYTILNKIIE